MDPVSNIIGLAISIACFAFLLGGRGERVLDTFGAGFLPYRKDGWPRGVQEGEPVAWRWSSLADRSLPAAEREVAPGTPAEIFEIDARVVADIVDGHLHGGTALRD